MEEDNLIPGAGGLLRFLAACASGIDSLCQWVGNALPAFLVEDLNGWTILLALVISIALWAVLHQKLYSRIPELYFKLSLPFWDAAFLLGMAAAYPFEMETQRGLGFFGWLYFDSYGTPVTWFNFREWNPFFQIWLALILIGTVVLGILFLFGGGLRGLLGTPVGMFALFILGFSLMRVYAWIYQVVCINALDENLLAALLNILLGFPQVIPLIYLPISFIALFLTREMMHDLAEARDARERRQRTQRKKAPVYEDYEIPYPGTSGKSVFPSSLRSPDGETYQLNYDNGERAEYLCKKTGDRVSFHRDDFEDGCPTGWNAY